GVGGLGGGVGRGAGGGGGAAGGWSGGRSNRAGKALTALNAPGPTSLPGFFTSPRLRIWITRGLPPLAPVPVNVPLPWWTVPAYTSRGGGSWARARSISARPWATVASSCFV